MIRQFDVEVESTNISMVYKAFIPGNGNDNTCIAAHLLLSQMAASAAMCGGANNLKVMKRDKDNSGVNPLKHEYRAPPRITPVAR